MVNFGPLAAEIGSVVWGTPMHKCQRVSRLGSVTARHYSSGCQPNFAALNRGRHLYSAGRPSRWALAHILVVTCFTKKDGLVLALQNNFQTRSDRKSCWSWTVLSVTIHSLLMFVFSWTDAEAAPLQHSLYRSPWHANDTCGLTLAVVTSLFIVLWLWLTKLFNLARCSSVIAVTALLPPFLHASVVPCDV